MWSKQQILLSDRGMAWLDQYYDDVTQHERLFQKENGGLYM